ncbi:MAG: hypothetical protein R2795_14815 [Saprospiraceae bacterium]
MSKKKIRSYKSGMSRNIKRVERPNHGLLPDKLVEIRFSKGAISRIPNELSDKLINNLQGVLDITEKTNPEKILMIVDFIASLVETDTLSSTTTTDNPVVPLSDMRSIDLHNIEWEITQSKDINWGDFFSPNNPASDKLILFFEDEYLHADNQEGVIKLAQILAPYWEALSNAPSELANESFDILISYQSRLAEYLKATVSLQIPTRKRLLAYLGSYLTELSAYYQFISPENASTVDPAFHTVVESQGTRIKVGLSFLVVRKSNKQVVIKADVITF